MVQQYQKPDVAEAIFSFTGKAFPEEWKAQLQEIMRNAPGRVEKLGSMFTLPEMPDAAFVEILHAHYNHPATSDYDLCKLIRYAPQQVLTEWITELTDRTIRKLESGEILIYKFEESLDMATRVNRRLCSLLDTTPELRKAVAVLTANLEDQELLTFIRSRVECVELEKATYNFSREPKVANHPERNESISVPKLWKNFLPQIDVNEYVAHTREELAALPAPVISALLHELPRTLTGCVFDHFHRTHSGDLRFNEYIELANRLESAGMFSAQDVEQTLASARKAFISHIPVEEVENLGQALKLVARPYLEKWGFQSETKPAHSRFSGATREIALALGFSEFMTGEDVRCLKELMSGIGAVAEERLIGQSTHDLALNYQTAYRIMYSAQATSAFSDFLVAQVDELRQRAELTEALPPLNLEPLMDEQTVDMKRHLFGWEKPRPHDFDKAASVYLFTAQQGVDLDLRPEYKLLLETGVKLDGGDLGHPDKQVAATMFSSVWSQFFIGHGTEFERITAIARTFSGDLMEHMENALTLIGASFYRDEFRQEIKNRSAIAFESTSPGKAVDFITSIESATGVTFEIKPEEAAIYYGGLLASNIETLVKGPEAQGWETLKGALDFIAERSGQNVPEVLRFPLSKAIVSHGSFNPNNVDHLKKLFGESFSTSDTLSKIEGERWYRAGELPPVSKQSWLKPEMVAQALSENRLVFVPTLQPSSLDDYLPATSEFVLLAEGQTTSTFQAALVNQARQPTEISMTPLALGELSLPILTISISRDNLPGNCTTFEFNSAAEEALGTSPERFRVGLTRLMEEKN